VGWSDRAGVCVEAPGRRGRSRARRLFAPDTILDTLAALPPAPADAADPYEGTRQLLHGLDEPSLIAEHVDIAGSRKTLDRVDLPDVPLVVLTAAANGLAGALPAALRRKTDAVWRDEQDELAGLSDDSVHAVARLSGHFIQREQPELVVAAIRAVERAARAHTQLAPCRAVFRGLAAGCLPPS
jgi:hypothetical protein